MVNLILETPYWVRRHKKFWEDPLRLHVGPKFWRSLKHSLLQGVQVLRHVVQNDLQQLYTCLRSYFTPTPYFHLYFYLRPFTKKFF